MNGQLEETSEPDGRSEGDEQEKVHGISNGFISVHRSYMRPS